VSLFKVINTLYGTKNTLFGERRKAKNGNDYLFIKHESTSENYKKLTPNSKGRGRRFSHGMLVFYNENNIKFRIIVANTFKAKPKNYKTKLEELTKKYQKEVWVEDAYRRAKEDLNKIYMDKPTYVRYSIKDAGIVLVRFKNGEFGVKVNHSSSIWPVKKFYRKEFSNIRTYKSEPHIKKYLKNLFTNQLFTTLVTHNKIYDRAIVNQYVKFLVNEVYNKIKTMEYKDNGKTKIQTRKKRVLSTKSRSKKSTLCGKSREPCAYSAKRARRRITKC